MTFEERPEGGEGVSLVMFCEEMSRAEGPARVEVPTMGRSLMCVRNSEESRTVWLSEPTRS